MSTTKQLFLTTLFLILAAPTFAAHIVGGGITYECLGPAVGGIRYRFTMKIYRDCAGGGAGFDNPANIAIYQGSYTNNSYFDDYQINIDDVFPLNINEPDCIDNLPNLCLQEGIYVWEDILPVSNESYFIVYQRCCRTNAIANITTPGDIGATYYIEITPLAQQLCNNSPVFNNFPPIVICNNYPLEVDYSATDAEGDLLVYSFCAPFAGGGNNPAGPGGGCDDIIPSPPCSPPFTEVPFIFPNYSAAEPMAGNPVVSINGATGIISGTPQLNGQFVVGVCVEEYRNGQLLSVTRRDFQFNVTDCDPQATALVQYDELLGPSRYSIKKCDGATDLTIINQSIPVNNIQNFEWTFDLGGGNVVQNSSDFDLPITFPGQGVYNGILVLNEGLDCGDTAFIQVELYAPLSLDLGPDYSLCQDTNIVLNAGPGFSSYLWQNGSTSQSINITTTGVYYVEATDPCGNVLRDTVTVSVGTPPAINLSNTSICPGASASFSAPGFAQYAWTGAGLNCNTCETVSASPASTTTYTLLASTSQGCTAEASVTVEVLPTPMQTYLIQFYPNETVTVGGQTYNQSATVTIPVPSTTGGCDSLNTYILELIPTTLDLACPADLTVALPNNSGSIPVNYNAPQATTDCPGVPPTITLTQGLASGTAFPGGVTTVCYQATNTCNNEATCCFTVTVTSLDLTCPPNLTVAMPSNANTVVVNYASPGVSTDCPGAVPVPVRTQGPASGSAFPAGLTTVCYQANNTCGNQDNCCFTVMVSTLSIQCPPNQNIELPVAATTVVANYAAPTTATNCPDPAVTLNLTQGLPSGGAFPLGVNTVCYQATNTCGNVASCCFNITVQDPPPPCDIKVIGCMKFELLDIRLDSINQPRFRIRATNFCASEVNYILNELPPGIVAVTPVEGSIYTAPNTGNTYLVRNPNFSPFYSVRYKSVSPGLKNGQSDVFEHRLPQQSFPNNYIHMYGKLKNGEGFEAYLNTFYCPVQPWMGSRLEERNEPESQLWDTDISLRPNPTPGQVWVDMQAWMDKQVSLRVYNTLGQEVYSLQYTVNQEWLELDMSNAPSNGLYYLIVQPEGGARARASFVLER
ncbi:MAG: HYR domain-containing protein [Chitinophagales bacterium]|nr:HYR domain-containing protein [Chitinophagales bacterium]